MVIVYLLTDNPASTECARLVRLFDGDDRYTVKHVTSRRPCDPDIERDLHPDKIARLDESYRVSQCFRDAESHPDEYIIILKDDSVTNTDGESVRATIMETIRESEFHICYLCKWLDRCDLYTDKRFIDGKSTIVAKTQAPHGMQALLISPQGRKVLTGELPDKKGSRHNLIDQGDTTRLLTENILKCSLDAVCVVPNLFDFDITKATKNTDYLKSMQCMPTPYPDSSTDPQGDNASTGSKLGSYAVFVIIIILLIIGLFLLFAGFPRC